MNWMNLFVTAAILFLNGCSTTSTTSGSATKSSRERPAWLDSPDEGGTEQEMCAVGEAAGKMMADASARNSLAQIFETKVKGTSTSNTTSDSKMSARGLEAGSVNETTSKQIEETTDEILKGVVVKKTYFDPSTKSTFALACLNKEDASSRFREQMKPMDTQMEELVKNGKRASINRALQIYKEREMLNRRYEIVAGNPYMAKVNLKELLGKKREKGQSNISIFLEFDVPKEAQDLKNLVVSVLTDNDYSVVEDDDSAHHFTVRGELNHEKEHMNVNGFEKHKFILAVRSMDKGGAKLGGIDQTFTESGRNFSQCLTKALPDIKKFLKDNLVLLNMD